MSLIATGSGDAEKSQQFSDKIVINNACISKVSLHTSKRVAAKALPLKIRGPPQACRQENRRTCPKSWHSVHKMCLFIHANYKLY